MSQGIPQLQNLNACLGFPFHILCLWRLWSEPLPKATPLPGQVLLICHLVTVGESADVGALSVHRGPDALGEVLHSCDFVCSILPETPATCNLLSGNVLQQCQERVSFLQRSPAKQCGGHQLNAVIPWPVHSIGWEDCVHVAVFSLTLPQGKPHTVIIGVISLPGGWVLLCC